MEPHYGEVNGAHVPHDSALSVGSAGETMKVRELEDEVRELADKANGACTWSCKDPARKRLVGQRHDDR